MQVHADRGPESDVKEGRIMAIRETLSLMQNQADAFLLVRAPLGLGGPDAELDGFPPVDSLASCGASDAQCPVGYVRDLVYLLRERLVEAHHEQLRRPAGSPFEQGREEGFRAVLAWMQDRVDALGIHRSEVGL